MIETNPCKQCIVRPMCGKACDEYKEYVRLHLEHHGFTHRRISLVADYLMRFRPARYYTSLSHISPDWARIYGRTYTLKMSGTTIMKVDQGIVNEKSM